MTGEVSVLLSFGPPFKFPDGALVENAFPSYTLLQFCSAESCSLSNTTFPHVLPLLSLLEKSMAVGEGTEPWETVEVGVDVVMFHLGAARTIAQLGGIYRSNVESKLQCKAYWVCEAEEDQKQSICPNN